MTELAETATMKKPLTSGGQCAAPGCAIRPILFSGPMVRAILLGKKAQTRRVIKDVSADCDLMLPAGDGWWQQCYRDDQGAIHSKSWLTKCPYGKPGDRLWVRETWAHNTVMPLQDRPGGAYIYRADLNSSGVSKYSATWRPSIHMPKAASRILLEITGIRAERLRAISDLEARMEGVAPTTPGGVMGCKRGFRDLWDSINGKRRGCSWGDNPFVWVVEFRRV